MTLQDNSWAKGFLVDLPGSGAKSCDSAGRLQKVQANADLNTGSREQEQM
jgi:hypothetical protein